jgi:hypothetical protein
MQDRERDARIEFAVQNTRVVRPPQQALATFGQTVIKYHMISRPVYADLDIGGQKAGAGKDETVVRDGIVRAERPQVVTPYYLSRLEGFSESASRYLEYLMHEYGPSAPGLLYTYKNEPAGMSFVSGRSEEVAAKLMETLDREEKALEAVIHGVDELWDVSLMKFIFELTNSSAKSNFSELKGMGLLEDRGGMPEDARRKIEMLLVQASRGEVEPSVVHRELERWGVFDQYEDRFLALFRGRK